MPQSLCRMLPCFWLLPRRDVRGLSGSLGLRSIGWTAPYSTSARKKTFIYKYSRVSARKFFNLYVRASGSKDISHFYTRALARGNFSICSHVSATRLLNLYVRASARKNFLFLFARQREEFFNLSSSRVSARKFLIYMFARQARRTYLISTHLAR